MGLRRPLASGAPSSIRVHSMAATRPASAITWVGATSSSICTPSRSASSISTGFAGISARVRRYRIVTSRAPRRSAVRAQSMAVFPPPTTITLPLTSTGRRNPTFFRNSMPESTPSTSSFFTRSVEESQAPSARKTASKPWFRREATVKSRPRLTFVDSFTPSSRICAISESSTSLGRRYSGMP